MQRARLLVPIVLLLVSTPLVAQRRDPFTPYDGPRRLELSAGVGYFWSSDWSDLILFESLGLVGEEARRVLMPSLSSAPGAGGQAAITYWKGRLGFRLHGGYMESCVTAAPRCAPGRQPPSAGGAPAINPTQVDLKTYFYGVQGVVALSEFNTGQWFRPYFMVGGGGVTFDPSEAIPRFLPGQQLGPTDGPETIVLGGPNQYTFTVGQAGLESRFAVTIGAGTDLRIPVGSGGLSLRMEVADHISRSPLGVTLTRVAGSGLHGSGNFQQIELGSGVVHNLRASVGLAVEFALRRPQRDPNEGFLPFPIPTPPGVVRERGGSDTDANASAGSSGSGATRSGTR